MRKFKILAANFIIKLSPSRWAEKQLGLDFDAQLMAHQETIYRAFESAKANRGE
ncbi:MAG: hypothetical protein ACPGUD_14790 [Parashewanella sp.]